MKSGANQVRSGFWICLLGVSLQSWAQASSGTEGASFLSIPVGAGPAALGAAYSALATDAYAPTWNPAGLGFADATGIAAQHLSYLDSIHYEYLSFVHPFDARDTSVHRGIGFSAQYLGTGDIARTDVDANGNFVSDGGSFSSHYGSYNASYGQTLGEKASVGVTGKWINAAIDNITANAYAVDMGAMYNATPKVHLATTLTNVGTQLKFIDEGDSLPMEFHAAAAYEPSTHYLLSAEGVYPKTGLASLHLGGQWRPMESVSLRAGYRTDTLKGLSPLAGFSTGVGLNVWGQEFAYAWVPYGDLGNTQYFSLLIKLGDRGQEKRNLIYYQTIKSHRTANNATVTEPEYQQLMQLLSDQDSHVAQSQTEGGASN